MSGESGDPQNCRPLRALHPNISSNFTANSRSPRAPLFLDIRPILARLFLNRRFYNGFRFVLRRRLQRGVERLDKFRARITLKIFCCIHLINGNTALTSVNVIRDAVNPAATISQNICATSVREFRFDRRFNLLQPLFD